MAQFNVGDRVRLVKDNEAWARSNMRKEGVVLRTDIFAGYIEVKFDNSTGALYEVDYGDPCALRLVEKANLHPEEITHNGVTYIRKPEPEHVWKFGDWARLRKDPTCPEEIVFVTGAIDRFGDVPFIFKGNMRKGNYNKTHPRFLEYISSATIPE